ncbi:hypothetical protein F5050DRAFT_1818497 [Lentinula boryana]|uniref:Uncharacterized protein n=1 Tax=Lentinula boryana TaxID=40481 RepID=A0ABQ8QDF6_9AGAR|nr:hypothetical protein F5050DRAFT_1818497 [Lentinula boryana]
MAKLGTQNTGFAHATLLHHQVIAIQERWFREKVKEITRISNLDADCLFPKAPIANEGGWSYSSQRWFGSFRQDPLLPSKRSLLADSVANEHKIKSVLSKVYHPSDAINNWLLQSNDTVDIAMTHDDDWAALIRDDDKEMPDDQELIRRVHLSPLHIRIQRRRSPTSSGHVYAHFSTSRPASLPSSTIQWSPSEGFTSHMNKYITLQSSIPTTGASCASEHNISSSSENAVLAAHFTTLLGNADQEEPKDLMSGASKETQKGSTASIY